MKSSQFPIYKSEIITQQNENEKTSNKEFFKYDIENTKDAILPTPQTGRLTEPRKFQKHSNLMRNKNNFNTHNKWIQNDSNFNAQKKMNKNQNYFNTHKETFQNLNNLHKYDANGMVPFLEHALQWIKGGT